MMLSSLADTLISRVVDGNCDSAKTAVMELEFTDKHKAVLSKENLSRSEAKEFMFKVIDKCTEADPKEEEQKGKKNEKPKTENDEIVKEE